MKKTQQQVLADVIESLLQLSETKNLYPPTVSDLAARIAKIRGAARCAAMVLCDLEENIGMAQESLEQLQDMVKVLK